ncbi:unnamed protein product [Microthlaspi erraticum]|uniref:Uncharacterized protein n=1 Tax=Microthlaspi erraticum TaxID=1685480 RepID=A0A6D2JA94_9BRAS|nr:unnamed protein product [Microthlaspi erraticum]
MCRHRHDLNLSRHLSSSSLLLLHLYDLNLSTPSFSIASPTSSPSSYHPCFVFFDLNEIFDSSSHFRLANKVPCR